MRPPGMDLHFIRISVFHFIPLLLIKRIFAQKDELWISESSSSTTTDCLMEIEIIGHYSYAASGVYIFIRVCCAKRPSVHCYACCLSALISATLELSTTLEDVSCGFPVFLFMNFYPSVSCELSVSL
uniref:Secreted protein n=1 Tax=Elaeophora elaphi TaxID=1147741 RepID=A0A0R3S2T7_9BILA